jgi:hypothetical protein
MRHAVLCYIEGRGSEWEALCLDFDLAVQGHSFDEVSDNLKIAIAQYIERVHQLPQAEQQALLNRRVPLLLRLKLIASALWWGMQVGGGDGASPERYSIALPCSA